MVEFCPDHELGYERSRTRFAEGAGLTMDEGYRRAHLPLVAPGHPRVIRAGGAYAMGQHARGFSLVLPVSWDALARSAAFGDLERELKAAPFARKIAWDIAERRRDRLHATICGSLSAGEDAPAIPDDRRRELARIGPVHAEVRGLFSGNVNIGRLYLAVYPERRDGENVFRRIQRILGRPETDLYVVGLYNLADDLDAGEATALANVIGRWRDIPLLRLRADHLVLLGATDDLVLGPVVAETVPLIP